MRKCSIHPGKLALFGTNCLTLQWLKSNYKMLLHHTYHEFSKKLHFKEVRLSKVETNSTCIKVHWHTNTFLLPKNFVSFFGDRTNEQWKNDQWKSHGAFVNQSANHVVCYILYSHLFCTHTKTMKYENPVLQQNNGKRIEVVWPINLLNASLFHGGSWWLSHLFVFPFIG